MSESIRLCSSIVLGWGINDVNYKVTKTNKLNGRVVKFYCPYYLDWKAMLTRVINPRKEDRYSTYIGCTISKDWRSLSEFIKWVDSQPNRDWSNCSLDKDLLVTGNKYYSQDTCVYIRPELNTFLISSEKKESKSMLGANYRPSESLRNPYKSNCRNPFTKEYEYMGRFTTELEAHKAWQSKKHEHACRLADLQDDPRVAEALRKRYAPDTDWTKA